MGRNRNLKGSLCLLSIYSLNDPLSKPIFRAKNHCIQLTYSIACVYFIITFGSIFGKFRNKLSSTVIAIGVQTVMKIQKHHCNYVLSTYIFILAMLHKLNGSKFVLTFTDLEQSPLFPRILFPLRKFGQIIDWNFF